MITNDVFFSHATKVFLEYAKRRFNTTFSIFLAGILKSKKVAIGRISRNFKRIKQTSKKIGAKV